MMADSTATGDRASNPTRDRYFVALLPPQPIQDYANQIKQHVADQYQSRAAQKSPPHITLQPPFEWQREQFDRLEEFLREFSQTQSTVPITLSGFGAFPPRVIYINVVKTSELLALQQTLMAGFETHLQIVHATAKSRSFAPHMTVAFRDLARSAFHAAWREFESQPAEFEFWATHLTLLRHNGQRWLVHAEYPLNS